MLRETGSITFFLKKSYIEDDNLIIVYDNDKKRYIEYKEQSKMLYDEIKVMIMYISLKRRMRQPLADLLKSILRNKGTMNKVLS
jgi:hypothetical protein